mmetsp:Transcript_61664/g.121092  ORF Transcript_61664/g.121092 Transcript_61664/m.121092 type:complete len:513 (-) Transcript_61664:357-1895(-)
MMQEVGLGRRLLVALLCALTTGGVTAGESTAPPSVGKLRSDADQAMVSGDVDKSIKLMNQVIQMEPENERNYLKRYRAHMRKRRLKDAFSDLDKALKINPKYKAAVGPKAKLALQMGRCAEAVADLHLLKTLDEKASELRDLTPATDCMHHLTHAEELEKRGDLGGAKDALGGAMLVADSSHDLLLRRATLEVAMGDYFEAVADSGRAIKLEPDSIAALSMRGQAYYLLGEHEMALNHWRGALKFDPEHPEVKESYRLLKKIEKANGKGDAHSAAGRPEEAIASWRAAIAADPAHRFFISPTSVKIAKAFGQLKKWGDAADSCQEALNQKGISNELKLEAELALGEALLGGEKYEDAMKWFQAASETNQQDPRAKEGHQKAQAALKQSKEVDHYKELGVARTATSKEIKKAYRGMALLHHPDKAAEDDREEAEKKFMKIAAAHEILSDDEMRGKYDRGEDVSGHGQQQQQVVPAPLCKLPFTYIQKNPVASCHARLMWASFFGARVTSSCMR